MYRGVHKRQAVQVWPHLPFLTGRGHQKCLLGSLPKPGSLGQNVPKRLSAEPPLSRWFLIPKAQVKERPPISGRPLNRQEIINFYVRLFLIAVGIAPTIKPTTSEINPFKSAMCFMLSKRYVIGSASSLIAHPGIK